MEKTISREEGTEQIVRWIGNEAETIICPTFTYHFTDLELQNQAACANILFEKIGAEGLKHGSNRIVWRQDKNFVGLRITDLRPLEPTNDAAAQTIRLSTSV